MSQLSKLVIDLALLYRQELGLDPGVSTMAVIVQELVVGECSGVAFSRCPGRPGLAAIEAVWGSVHSFTYQTEST